jgi:hypothetical protein
MASHASHNAHDTHDAHVDDWHQHSAAEGEPQQEHGGIAKTGVIFLWFVGGVVFLLATIGALIMYFDKNSTDQRALVIEAQPAKQFWAQYESRRAEMVANVAPQGYQLIDPAKGTARPPIEVTMRRVAEDYQKRQSPK